MFKHNGTNQLKTKKTDREVYRNVCIRVIQFHDKQEIACLGGQHAWLISGFSGNLALEICFIL